MNTHCDIILQCGNSQAVIRALDSEAARLLAGLPEFIPAMFFEKTPSGRRAHLLVAGADDLPGTRRLSARNGCGFHLNNAGDELIFRITPREYDSASLIRLWCYVLCGAVYSAIAHGEELFMLHGGMNECCDATATAWFGHSGIGKSTLASRLASVGVRVPADDALLLAPRDGGFVVRSLPTWSRAIAMTSGEVPKMSEVEWSLGRLLLLDRNSTASEVREIDRLTFHARLFGAMSAHLLFMMKIAPSEMNNPVKQRIFAAAAQLSASYSPHCLFAALGDTDVVAHLLTTVN